MAIDAHKLPIAFEITGGEVHDCKVASEFIETLPDADFIVADKGYGSEYDSRIFVVAYVKFQQTQ